MPKKVAKKSSGRLNRAKPRKGLTTHAHNKPASYAGETEAQLVTDVVSEMAQGHTPIDNPALADEIDRRSDQDPSFAQRWDGELDAATGKPVL